MFGLAVAAAGRGSQLPPQVLFDQLLLRTERLVEAIEEPFVPVEQHELELAPRLRPEHGRVAFAVGLLGKTKESVTAYLTSASRESESAPQSEGPEPAAMTIRQAESDGRSIVRS